MSMTIRIVRISWQPLTFSVSLPRFAVPARPWTGLLPVEATFDVVPSTGAMPATATGSRPEQGARSLKKPDQACR